MNLLKRKSYATEAVSASSGDNFPETARNFSETVRNFPEAAHNFPEAVRADLPTSGQTA
jgi:hypothetical protein